MLQMPSLPLKTLLGNISLFIQSDGPHIIHQSERNFYWKTNCWTRDHIDYQVFIQYINFFA